MIFFILVGGAPGTIWDHIKPKNGPKKGPKTGQKRPKIGPGRRHLGRRPISIKNVNMTPWLCHIWQRLSTNALGIPGGSMSCDSTPSRRCRYLKRLLLLRLCSASASAPPPLAHARANRGGASNRPTSPCSSRRRSACPPNFSTAPPARATSTTAARGTTCPGLRRSTCRCG